MDYIEAGWPGSNPKDAEFFQLARGESWHDRLVAFGSTRRKGTFASEDPQVQALVESGVPTVCIVAKAHLGQVTEILRASPEENLEMISDTVMFLCSKGIQVMVDLEHFFDGFNLDKEYTLKCGKVATEAGASCIVLCDTNGGSMPWSIGEATKFVTDHFTENQVTIGIHCHNDCGMAVANSLSGCQNGVGLIQGTVNGIGERTGNADLCTVAPSLALHMGSQLKCRGNMPELTKLSRYVDEILNRTPDSAAPYVGSSAFAHKGGLHVAAMERSPLSYQHIWPEEVGNEKRILISELSGRQNIMGKMEAAGVFQDDTSIASERAMAILNRVKSLEAVGYTFEGADASVHLMILHATRGYCSPFQVLDYSVQVYDHNMDSASRVLRLDADETKRRSPSARATIKVRTMKLGNDESPDGDKSDLPFEDRLEVADGCGPVNALGKALRRALHPSQPYLLNVELVDYKVRILDPESATSASTRVMIEFKDKATESRWTTVSVDENVISASLNALVDGFEYALIEHAESCMLCDDFYQ